MNNAIAVTEVFARLRAEIVGLFRILWAKPELPGLKFEAMRQLSAFLEKHGFSMSAEALAAAAVEILSQPAHADRARRELECRVEGVSLNAPRLGAWNTLRQDPQSFWDATWVE